MKLQTVCLALLTLTAALPSSAEAESIDAAPAEVCVGMTVSGPRVFPTNAKATVKVTVSHGQIANYEEPEVLIAVENTYESVSFELADGDLVSRNIVLDELVEGSYIVTWGGGDCIGMQSPVNASKTVVGSFEILAESEPPTELGQLLVDESSYGGRAPGWYAELVVALSESALPWQDLMTYGVEVDGQAVEEFSTAIVRNGDVTLTYGYQCEDNPIPPGLHEIQVVGTLDGDEVRTAPVEVDIVCQEPTKGCSVGAVGSGTWLGVFVMLGLVGFRRRKDRYSPAGT